MNVNFQPIKHPSTQEILEKLPVISFKLDQLGTGNLREFSERTWDIQKELSTDLFDQSMKMIQMLKSGDFPNTVDLCILKHEDSSHSFLVAGKFFSE